MQRFLESYHGDIICSRLSIYETGSFLRARTFYERGASLRNLNYTEVLLRVFFR
jgi:hypothetical protein